MSTRPYVIVTGHLNASGGMDRANYALAWHLADRAGAEVHLVSHGVAAPLSDHRNVTWHRVPKPLNSIALGAPLLGRRGRKVAAALAPRGARVVSNGGICPWPDVNWVHAVHAAWPNRDAHAPLRFRLRNRWAKSRARRGESHALGMAGLIVTNSEKARRQIIEHLRVPAERVRVAYLGTDPAVFKPATEADRQAARRRLGLHPDRPVAAFVGALGHDRNKGFDTLYEAWQQLCNDRQWDVDLVAAGSGAEVRLWRHRATAAGLADRVRLIGFTGDIATVLAAADVLVAPSHYEAYGLAVHEALCCGLPAFVSVAAGIAERYPPALQHLLLRDPGDANELVTRLRDWRSRPDAYRQAVEPLSRELRSHTWEAMAEQMVRVIDERHPTGDGRRATEAPQSNESRSEDLAVALDA